MINFYQYCSKPGLTNEHYGKLIEQMKQQQYTIDLKPIECLLKKNPKHAYWYSFEVLKDRFAPAEPYLLKAAPWLIVKYAKHVINGRWPEAESFIMESPYLAFQYADAVIKGRWIEAEPVIMTNAESAFLYAKYVLKGRWPDAETTINSSEFYRDVYTDLVRTQNHTE
jgi:hypothetical protein